MEDSDLTVIHDHKGNEIRFHGDGRVRISSKKSTDFNAPAQPPDVASFELTGVANITALWSTIKALMMVAEKMKTAGGGGGGGSTTAATVGNPTQTTPAAAAAAAAASVTGEQDTTQAEILKLQNNVIANLSSWTIFFRKAGNPTQQVGVSVSSQHQHTQNLQDALIKAEATSRVSQTVGGGAAATIEDEKTLSKADGGGEVSEFRVKLRRQSIAIRSGRSNSKSGSSQPAVRRKSYAANMQVDQEKDQVQKQRRISERAEAEEGEEEEK